MDVVQASQALEIDIKKSEIELKAKKILLKRIRKDAKRIEKGTERSFIESKPVRAVNHVLAFVTYPFARVHYNARMRLDKPKTYRAEVALAKAEKLLTKCQNTSSAAGRKAVKLALKSTVTEAALTEYEAIPELRDRVQKVRDALMREGKRLGASVVEVGSGMGIDDLISSLGLKTETA